MPSINLVKHKKKFKNILAYKTIVLSLFNISYNLNFCVKPTILLEQSTASWIFFLRQSKLIFSHYNVFAVLFYQFSNFIFDRPGVHENTREKSQSNQINQGAFVLVQHYCFLQCAKNVKHSAIIFFKFYGKVSILKCLYLASHLKK